MKKLINFLVILFLSINISIGQTDSTFKYLDTLTGEFVFPNEDAHVLSKIGDELVARGLEIEDFYKEEVTWLEYKAKAEESHKYSLKQIINLMENNNSLRIDLAKQKYKSKEAISIMLQKDNKLISIDKARRRWKTAAIATPPIIGFVYLIIKYIIPKI